MRLSDLEINTEATIVRLGGSEELVRRLNSFGVIPGADIMIEKVSLAKQTMSIVVETTQIGLRFSEADKIEVEDA